MPCTTEYSIPLNSIAMPLCVFVNLDTTFLKHHDLTGAVNTDLGGNLLS